MMTSKIIAWTVFSFMACIQHFWETLSSATRIKIRTSCAENLGYSTFSYALSSEYNQRETYFYMVKSWKNRKMCWKSLVYKDKDMLLPNDSLWHSFPSISGRTTFFGNGVYLFCFSVFCEQCHEHNSACVLAPVY